MMKNVRTGSKMRVWPIILFAFLFSTRLFAAQENDLAEMQQLHQQAERAMMTQNYSVAKDAYIQLLRSPVAPLLSSYTSNDILLRLVAAERELGYFEHAEQRIKAMLKTPLPTDLLLKASLLQAYLRQDQKDTRGAYYHLHVLSKKIPTFTWPPKDNAHFCAIAHQLEEEDNDLMRHAKRLRNATLFSEASILYQELLENIRTEHTPLASTPQKQREKTAEISYLLADTYLQAEKPELALQLLIGNKFDEHTHSIPYAKECCYLLATAYVALTDYSQGADTLKLYLEHGNRNDLRFYNQATRLLGHCYASLGNTEQAAATWKSLLTLPIDKETKQLTELELARLALTEGHLHEALEQLKPLEPLIQQEHALSQEILYLKGEIHDALGNYTTACSLYEQALPKQNKERIRWYPQALYNLGWTYLKSAVEEGKEPAACADFLLKAERAFSEVSHIATSLKMSGSDTSLDEKAVLALGKVYLIRFQKLKIESAHTAFHDLLSRPGLLTSLEGQAEAALLQAEAAGSYELSMDLLKELTLSSLLDNTLAAKKGWYLRGTLAYRQAEQLLAKQDPTAASCFAEAAEFFLHACSALHHEDLDLASTSRFFAALSYFHQGNSSGKALALKLLDSLRSDPQLFAHNPHPDEVLYFYGMIAAQMFRETKDPLYETQAELALTQLHNAYTHSQFVDDGLFLLANMYYENGAYSKAEPIFLTLAEEYPLSPFAGEAWFWAADSLEKQAKEPNNVSRFRKRVFEEYPTCSLADESYFRLYAFDDYLHGSPETLEHLKKMQQRFPNSPYLILVNYLIALEAKEKHLPSEALLGLRESVSFFDKLYSEGKIPAAHFPYFVSIRYLACLEQALLYQTCTEEEGMVHLKEAQQILEDMRDDFSNPLHALTQKLLSDDSYPRLYEESDFVLSQLYLKTGKQEAAEKILTHLIANNKALGRTHGYYLAQAWTSLGALAKNGDKPELALERFKQAEQAGHNGSIPTEQRLQLWIDQSHCYRSLQQLDQAMLMLSRVINENAASGLRIQAMLLRADLYTEQGRHELAIKQLEAAAQKGGEYAVQAKNKLRDYGIPTTSS